ncbi:MAG: protein kinase [Gemmatimonadaceae bacterium]
MELRDRLQATLGNAYAIERELDGAGMSRVYVAEETAIRRRVVVKVLRPDFAEGLSAERFQREIVLAARLQHPHIVPLLSAGTADGVLYYTMPFVEGESLRGRLRREGELPIPDVVRIMRDVASALAYAHRHGVVHRDIKPENILLTDGGAVVADFGIAKAISVSRTEGDGGAANTLTQRGTALGTPQYMAPEQATGDSTTDHRADLYALGMVAYEMLAGRPPFAERSVQALMAAHATEVPEAIARRRPNTPPVLGALVMECLEKHPADRPQSAEEIIRALDGIVATPGGSPTLLVGRTGLETRTYGRRRTLPWVGAALLAMSAGVLAASIRRSNDPVLGPSHSVRRWNLVLPDSAPMAFIGSAGLGIGRTALGLSPDGSVLAYVARVGGTSRLYIRPLSELRATPVPGSEGAFQPFFSPDSRWVAFFTGTELKKVAVSGGGRPVSLAQLNEPYGGAWLPDGRILIAENQGRFLSAIPESGGAPRRLAARLTGRIRHPQLLSTGWLLSSSGRLMVLTSLETGRQYALTRDGLVARDSVRPGETLYGSSPRYVASGHIVYASSGEDGVLMALPFDAYRRRVLGPPAPVLEGVRQEGEAGLAQWSVADDGTLIYAPGANAGRTRLVWRDRLGTVEPLPFAAADYGEFRLSPDGRMIIARGWPPASAGEFWLLDLTRGTSSKVSVDFETDVYGGVWWPDGRSFLISGLAEPGRPSLTFKWSITAPGSRDTVWRNGRINAVSPDGRWLAVYNPSYGRGVWLASRESPSGQPTLVDADAFFVSFSPDSRWLAFTSSQTGQSEVYVARLPELKERYKVSAAGGEEAIWSRRGDEIVYRFGERWFAVDVSTRDGFTFGRPRLVFEGPHLNVPGWSHDLSPDGRRHLVLIGPPEETTRQLNVVTNWFAELRRLAPARAR